MTEKSNISWLELPPRELSPYLGNSLLHGAGKVAGSYVGLRSLPQRIRGAWIHGWLPDSIYCLDPDMPFGERVEKDSVRYVASKAHEKYLREGGYHAKAIGLPIAYLAPKTYPRRPRSLLVMPVHSETSTTHKWKFREYAEQIAAMKPQFDQIVACVHTSCITNGYWVDDFASVGIPVVEGAHGCDLNSLERIRALASQFEFVTTNGFGSHIAYGAAFGAKVSIHGEFCNYTEEDHTDLEFYASRPGLLEKLIASVSETSVRSVLGEFFRHPSEAEQKLEWGLEQIGYHNRVSPAEMRKCFGWEWYRGPAEKVQQTSKRYFQRASNRLLTHRMRAALDERSDPALKARNTELRRLAALPPDQPGTASLEGGVFHFTKAKEFLEEYRAVFEQNACAFLSVKSSPVIIDWGAGIGVPLGFWAKKYPAPVVHCYTALPEKRECLRKNAALAANARVVVHEDVDKLTGLLEGEVDFLRINLGNESASFLLKIGERLKSVKRCLVVCQTEVGRAQSLSRVLALLEHSGFRYHLQAPDAASNPMTYLPIKDKADCFVNIWAYRGKKFPYAVAENAV